MWSLVNRNLEANGSRIAQQLRGARKDPSPFGLSMLPSSASQ